MEHIHEERAAELLTGGELIAYNDFYKVLNDLLGNATRQGRILKCTERQETFNDHISIEGQLGDVLNTLETNPWTARHYFRCVVERPGIQANRGFGRFIRAKWRHGLLCISDREPNSMHVSRLLRPLLWTPAEHPMPSVKLPVSLVDSSSLIPLGKEELEWSTRSVLWKVLWTLRLVFYVKIVDFSHLFLIVSIWSRLNC